MLNTRPNAITSHRNSFSECLLSTNSAFLLHAVIMRYELAVSTVVVKIFPEFKGWNLRWENGEIWPVSSPESVYGCQALGQCDWYHLRHSDRGNRTVAPALTLFLSFTCGEGTPFTESEGERSCSFQARSPIPARVAPGPLQVGTLSLGALPLP